MPLSIQETRVDSPHNAGAAFALPLSLESFLDDLDSNSHREYAKLQRKNKLLLGDVGVWREHARKEADRINRAADNLKRLGVDVRRDCTRAALTDLLSCKEVVVVFAHWQEGELQEDSVADWPALAHTILESATPAIAKLREYLKRVELLEAVVGYTCGPYNDAVDRLRTAINSAIRTEVLSPDADWMPGEAGDASRMHHNRLAIDAAVAPGVLRRGTGLELEDTILTAAEVVGLMPRIQLGTIDLSVCLSSVIADSARAENLDWRVLGNRAPTRPLFRALICEQAFALLARNSGNYIRTVTEIRDALINRQTYESSTSRK